MMNATSEKLFMISGDIILAYSNGVYNNLHRYSSYRTDDSWKIKQPLKKLHNRLQSLDAYDSALIKEEIKSTAQEIFTLSYEESYELDYLPYTFYGINRQIPRYSSPFDTTLVISVVY